MGAWARKLLQVLAAFSWIAVQNTSAQQLSLHGVAAVSSPSAGCSAACASVGLSFFSSTHNLCFGMSENGQYEVGNIAAASNGSEYCAIPSASAVSQASLDSAYACLCAQQDQTMLIASNCSVSACQATSPNNTLLQFAPTEQPVCYNTADNSFGSLYTNQTGTYCWYTKSGLDSVFTTLYSCACVPVELAGNATLDAELIGGGASAAPAGAPTPAVTPAPPIEVPVSPSSPGPPPPSSGGNSLSASAIVGIILGLTGAAATVLVFVWRAALFRREKRRLALAAEAHFGDPAAREVVLAVLDHWTSLFGLGPKRDFNLHARGLWDVRFNNYRENALCWALQEYCDRHDQHCFHKWHDVSPAERKDIVADIARLVISIDEQRLRSVPSPKEHLISTEIVQR